MSPEHGCVGLSNTEMSVNDQQFIIQAINDGLQITSSAAVLS